MEDTDKEEDSEEEREEDYTGEWEEDYTGEWENDFIVQKKEKEKKSKFKARREHDPITKRILFDEKPTTSETFDIVVHAIKEDLFKYLAVDILPFAAASSTLLKMFSPIVNGNLRFRQEKDGKVTQFIYWRPQKVTQVRTLKKLHNETKLIRFDRTENLQMKHILQQLPNMYSVTHIEFNYQFNQPLDASHLPPSLTHLTFGWNFDQKITTLPASLTHLTFGEDFNQSFDSVNLPSLTHLEFNFYFNHSLDSLPPSLRHLNLSHNHRFNLRIDFLPPSLTYLALSDIFNHSVDSLPRSLTHLVLGTKFNQRIDFLPPSLTYLAARSYAFDKPIYSLPCSLTHLTLCTKNTDLIDFPPSLTHLLFSTLYLGPIYNLPSSLIYLAVTSRYYNNPITFPPSLTHLVLGEQYNQPLSLPSTLTFLSLGLQFKQKLSISNLPSLTYLEFYSKGNIIPPIPPKCRVVELEFDMYQRVFRHKSEPF